MKRLLLGLFVLVFVPSIANAIVVAKQDFDGGDINLISSSVTNLDGAAGDFFGVGNRNAWPQGFPSPGMPFSLADDSVVGVSNGGAPLASDTEGIFGQNSDFDNDFFALSDTREWTADQLVATWTFDITGYSNLSVAIDMGGITNASAGGYTTDTDITFTASIDAGPEQMVFNVDPVDNTSGYLTRLMDVGTQSGGGRLLTVGGDQVVTKLLAETGLPATDTFFDKTPASGAGAGLMDTFRSAIDGAGTTLVITMRASVPFEAAAFDNIVIESEVVTPTKTDTWGSVKARYRK
jgi:hypothetical protein